MPEISTGNQQHQRKLNMERLMVKGLERIREAMKSDEGLAWSWHCNIAMLAVDSGGNHKEANIRTAKFMDDVFGVDTSKFKEYLTIMRQYEN